MLYDIAALQPRCGANMTYHTGNDAYTGPNSIVQPSGMQAALIRSMPRRAQARDHRFPRGRLFLVGALNNLAIAYNAVIEKAIGGAGAER